ncbi:MAG: glycosyltransferase family 2 protein [Cyanobacteria bacterium REEB67]|nr:glycosyltransferase family 2 protein [Cyanobacteria bacterium REEB67]
MLVAFFLLAITVLGCIVQTLAFNRLMSYVASEMAKPLGKYLPPVTVILPCKGLDPGFNDNVRKLLNQDYPCFEVIFAVASTDDPAYQNLVDLAAASSLPIKIVVAGINLKRAQKINNQLKALENLSPESEVIVFVDSDVIARADFLRHLVAPLEGERVGVCTGYRFYIASLSNWPSQLRSLWNRMSAWEMANQKYAFAWGGAMAIRKTVFEKAGVAAHWDQAADDDLSLTTAVKELGLDVHFVPQCLVATDGDSSVAEIFEWTNRQLILTKVYYPKLWGRAVGRAVVMAVWLIAMIGALGGWLLFGDRSMGMAVFAGLTLIPLEVIFLIRARRLWQQVLTDNSQYIQESFLTSCAAIPLAHLILPWITLFSLLTNRIQWRGITYELRSPTETLIIS